MTCALEKGPQPPYDFGSRKRAQVERTAEALARLPQNLVPEDLRTPERLVLAPDGAEVTVETFEMLVKSYVSLSPSGRRIAIADRGRSLTVVALDTGAQHRAEAVHLVLREATIIKDIRWSPDEGWVLFTEQHYQRGELPVGVAKPPISRKVVSLIRALEVESGEVVTLVAGENGFWVPRP